MLYRFLRFIIVMPFFRLFYPTKIINRSNFIDDRAIYICNHYSISDAFVQCAYLFNKYMHVLIKKEAFKNRFASYFLTKIGMISVDRQNFDIKSYKRVMSILDKNESIVMFPEGTRNKNNTEKLAPLKSGAAIYSIKTKTPIIPMLYYNNPRMFRKNYLIIGEPIDLSAYYDIKVTSKIKEESVALIGESLNELRDQINNKLR